MHPDLIVIHGYYVRTIFCVCASAIYSSAVVAVAAVFFYFSFFLSIT